MTEARPSRRALLASSAAVVAAGAGAAALWATERSGHDTQPVGYLPPTLGPAVRASSDVCVYGGTPAGVAAAIQARRLGRGVALVVLGDHVGGMMSAGLSATDHGYGGDEVAGGLARAFFRHVAEAYGAGADGYTFEPHLAETVMDRMLAASGVRVFRRQPLRSVERSGAHLTALTTLSGSRFSAGAFVDASYEGDLMAAAGVTHTVGREGRSAYSEALAGVGLADGPQSFHARVDPYVRPGDPSSGLLPGPWLTDPAPVGQGDPRVQAYTFRLCVRIDANGPQLPFPRPRDYDRTRYALLARYIRTGVWDALSSHTALPNGKADLNSNGGFSTDYVGGSGGWAEGDYATRQRIFAEHVDYQQGLLWFLAHDSEVPDQIRHRVAQFGLAPDEFVATGGWPHELYVREARRMRSDVVVTQSDTRGHSRVRDAVAYGYYPVDSHPCARVVVGGAARNEGVMFAPVPGPYRVPYAALVPPAGEVDNLVVPVCLSASHVAFCSLRVEPTLMALGQAAGAAAALAVRERVAVQRVPYAALRLALVATGQRL